MRESSGSLGTRSPARRFIAAFGGAPQLAIVAGLVLVGIAVRYPPAVGVLVGFAVFVPLERRWRRHSFPALRPGLGTDVLHFLLSNTAKTGGIPAAGGISWLLFHPLRLRAVSDALSGLAGWQQAALTFAGFQVTYYWEHRLAHRWGFLWRFQSVHHSSQRLDWLAATRPHPVEGFIGGFVLTAPLILAGFPLTQIGVAGVLFAVNDILIHANVRWRLPRLSRWMPTPEYHHWHHSNEKDAHDKNFGWPVLDRAFGTFYFPADRRPTVYGIDEPTPDGYLAQLRDPMRRSWPRRFMPPR